MDKYSLNLQNIVYMVTEEAVPMHADRSAATRGLACRCQVSRASVKVPFSNLLCDAFTVIGYKQLSRRVRGPGTPRD